MMFQKPQSNRNRIQAQEDYQTNIEAKQSIEALQIHLNSIETQKLEKIITMPEEMQKIPADKIWQ